MNQHRQKVVVLNGVNLKVLRNTKFVICFVLKNIFVIFSICTLYILFFTYSTYMLNISYFTYDTLDIYFLYIICNILCK